MLQCWLRPAVAARVPAAVPSLAVVVVAAVRAGLEPAAAVVAAAVAVVVHSHRARA